MSRPLFNQSIVQLEASFEERKTDIDFLKILAEELSFRSTGRAKKLKTLVTEILNAASETNKRE